MYNNLVFYPISTIDQLNNKYVGQKFNKLLIECIYQSPEYDFSRKDIPTKNVILAKCRCDCGNICSIILDDILNGTQTNCGCIDYPFILQDDPKFKRYNSTQKRHIVYQRLPKFNEAYPYNNHITIVKFPNKPDESFLIDTIAWNWLKRFKWVWKEGYAVTNNQKFAFRLNDILLSTPVVYHNKYMIDHKNRNKLDNTYFNLRCITSKGNALNSERYVDNSTGIIGVRDRSTPNHPAFEAYMNNVIDETGRKINLSKTFPTLVQAIYQRQEWEMKYRNIEKEIRITPSLFLPDGRINLNFKFNWYPPRYNVIWNALGLFVYPIPYDLNHPCYYPNLETPEYIISELYW